VIFHRVGSSWQVFLHIRSETSGWWRSEFCFFFFIYRVKTKPKYDFIISQGLFSFSFFFFNLRIIALKCCTGFCQITTGTSQNCILICILSLLSFPPPSCPTPSSSHTEPPGCLYSRFPLTVCFTHATFSVFPILSFPYCVHNFILYVCVSIPSLQIGSLVLFF